MALGLIMKFSAILTLITVAVAAGGPDAHGPLGAEEQVRLRALLKEARDSGSATQVQFIATSARLGTDPCKHVNRELTASDQAQLELALAKNLQIPNVEVYSRLSIGKWLVIHSNVSPGDPTYGFYSSDPLKGGKPVAFWSGGAPFFEVGDIAKWASDNVPGVPEELAECFAWSVTLSAE